MTFDFCSLYEAHFDHLVDIAVLQFRVPEAEAQSLAHEVFLTFLRSSQRVRDQESWLDGAMRCAARNFVAGRPQ
jgi:DNA-directed RNA polymerase specialized sigma24 family protein